MYITRLRPAVDPVSAEYLLTFGSERGSEIALNLGSVRGLDALTDVFRAGQVPAPRDRAGMAGARDRARTMWSGSV